MPSAKGCSAETAGQLPPGVMGRPLIAPCPELAGLHLLLCWHAEAGGQRHADQRIP